MVVKSLVLHQEIYFSLQCTGTQYCNQAHHQNCWHYCKTLFFTCPLFCKFCDLGDVITGHKYSKSQAILVYYLIQQAKMQ